VEDFDEIVREEDGDFKESGLKVTSLIRVGRLAVVEGNKLVGSIGEIRRSRLSDIRMRLGDWLTGSVSLGSW
jgi:mRNA interferase MazF